VNKKRSKNKLLTLTIAATIIAAPLALSLPTEYVAAATQSIKHKLITQPFNIEGKQSNIAVINKDNTTYIALRSLNNNLGIHTDFNKATQTVKVTGRDRLLEIGLSSGGARLNGQPIFGLIPIVQDNTTYLPLRNLLERMGYAISYDTASKLIGINAIQENKLQIHAQEIGADGDGKSLLVHYPVISGYENATVQQQINTFLKAEADKHVAAGSKEMDQANEGFNQIKAANPKESVPQPSFEGYYTVTYNEQGRLSLYVDYYVYLGGAHGNTVRVPYTFDLATGNVLSLKEVAESNEKYVSIINNRIKAEINSRKLPLLTPFDTIEADREYYLNHNGIVIYFGQYEYTSYAEGMPQFIIPLTEFK
jgi:hypothetical protein